MRRGAARRRRAGGRFERDARCGLQRASARYESARVPEAAAGVQDADLGLCRGPRRRGARRRRQGGDGEERRARSPRAEETYGVSRYMLAAIWGVESNFGAEMGKRPLVQSLSHARLLWASAPAYFRSELMAALKIIDRGDIPADKLAGSWAGAFGQTQFMPSTFLRLAVDLDGDGRRDIVDSAADALGLDRQLSRQVRLALRRPLGLRGEAAGRLFRPLGAEGEAADVGLGGARIDADRRAPARRGRGGAAVARRRRRPGLSGDAQFRRRLFLQRRRILFARRLRRSPTGSRAGRASSRPGRPTIPACRASSAASCRRCSPNTATTSASRTARSGRRPSRRSPISRARTACRSTAGRRRRCWRR